MNMDIYKKGDILKYKRGRRCTFEEYESLGWTGKPWQEYYNDHCAFVTFNSLLGKKKTVMVWLSDLKK